MIRHLLCAILLVGLGCTKKPAAVVTKENPVEGRPPIDQVISDLKSKSLGKRASALPKISQYESGEAIPPLLAALREPGFSENATVVGEPNSTREAAMIALLKFGEPGEKAAVESGIPILIEGLSDPGPTVRERTIAAISLLGPHGKAAIDPLLKSCTDTNEGVRRAAYAALQKLGGPPPMGIGALLGHADPKVVFDALVTLNTIRPLPKELIPKFIDVLKRPLPVAKASDDPKQTVDETEGLVRIEAAEALASFGRDASSAVPALMNVLQATTPEEFAKFYRPRPSTETDTVRTDGSPVMLALRKIGKPAGPSLIEGLKSSSWLMRWQSARVLGNIGPDDADPAYSAEALRALQEAFDKEFDRTDPSLSMVIASGLAITQLGGEAEKPIAKISELLTSDSAGLRNEAVIGLMRFGRKGSSAVKALIPLLSDPEPAIRFNVAETLYAFGPAAKEAVPALGLRLQDEDEEVRRSAVQILIRLGTLSAETTPALTKLLGDKDEGLRRDAIAALKAIGPSAKDAAPAIAKLLKALDDRERRLAIEALGAIGPAAKNTATDMVAALPSKDVETRVLTARSLGIIGNASPDVVKTLAGLLKDDYMSVRAAAIRALALLGPAARAAVPEINTFKGNNPNSVAAVWGAVALFKIGTDANVNLPIVVAALKNRAPSARIARLAAMDAADLLGPDAKGVMFELVDALTDRAPISQYDPTTVRVRAVQALGTMGPAAKDHVGKLIALLKEPDHPLRSAVLDTLGRIGPAADKALPRLNEIIRTDPLFAEQAQETADKIKRK